MFNDKLAELRRDVQRDAKQADRDVLKVTRWLLLKNPENLNEERNEKQRLEEALQLNKPLAAAYYLKEDLRQVWGKITKAEAEFFLDDWVARARITKIKQLEKFADS